MEIFISNLQSRTTKEQLLEQLKPLLQQHSVDHFDINKKVGKTHGFLTIPDFGRAYQILTSVQKNPSYSLLSIPGKQLSLRQSNRPPNTHLLRVLQKEQKDLNTRNVAQTIGKAKRTYQEDPTNTKDGLLISKIECGRWETFGDRKDFIPYFTVSSGGVVTRQPRALKVKLNHSPKIEVVMDIDNIRSLAILPRVDDKYTALVALALAPRIYERWDSDQEDYVAAMLNLNVSSKTICFRETRIPGCAQTATGSCLAYRLTASRSDTKFEYFKEHLQDLTSFRAKIVRESGMPKSSEPQSFERVVVLLDTMLKQLNWPFLLRFQIQKLWANAVMSPDEVRALLPDIVSLRARIGDEFLVSLLRRLCLQLQVADVYASGVKEARLIIQQQETFLQHEGQIFSQRKGRDEVSIHRVVVTPTGIYLYGPDETVSNRVLRQYRAYQDCFLRVSFTDENEDRVEFDRDCSNERILRGRFLTVLQKGLDIAGEHFDFLGFSHSSLRSQSCWFMRPFVHEGSLLNARSLIQSLGNFSSIRCPAKCAARIGQAFSESTSAVKIEPSIVHQLPDIRIGQYLFTDGCGTISKDTWKLLRSNHSARDQPTLYQIRYKGKRRHSSSLALLT